MILSFDGNGNIKTLVPSRVYQGSNKASSISIVAPFSEPNTMSILFRLPNAETTEPLPLIGGNEFYNGMFIWTLDIDKSITKYAGQVNFQVKATNTNGEVIATGNSYFMVEKGIIPSLPEIPSAKTYESILSQLSNLYTSKVDRVDIYNVPSDISFNLNGYKTPNVVYYDKENGYSLFVSHFKIPSNTFENVDWNVNGLYGRDVWQDTSGNYFFLNNSDKNYYRLNKETNTWTLKSFNEITRAEYIWNDGVNTYYSTGSRSQYVLDKDTLLWNKTTWNGFDNIYANGVWKANGNIYYTDITDNSKTYKLDKGNGSWILTNMDMSDFTNSGANFDSKYTWQFGAKTYYSNAQYQFIFNESTYKWDIKEWNLEVVGSKVWTDDVDIYYSDYNFLSNKQYVLNQETGEWKPKDWGLVNNIEGDNIWKVGNTIYCSSGSTQYRLAKEPKISQVETKIEKNQNVYTRFINIIDNEEHEVFENSDWIYLNKKILAPLINDLINRVNAIEKEVIDLGSLPNENKNRIDGLEPKVYRNTEDIADLRKTLTTGENYVGQTTEAGLPNNEKLNSFVLRTTNRHSKVADVVIYVEDIPDATNKIYKCKCYDNLGLWNFYEIPSLEEAKNGSLGIFAGNYEIGSSDQTQIDVVDGYMKGLYVSPEGALVEINTILHELFENITNSNARFEETTTKVDEILNGTRTVEKANSAINDGFGNSISGTYQPISDMQDYFTKDESLDMFLPSTYTNIFYYSKNGIVDDVPTTPADQKQFEVTSNTIGDTLIFKVDRTTIAKYNFNKNTTDQSSIWVSTDRDCELNFRLTTKGAKGGVEKLLNAELSGILSFKANELKQINIKSIYSNLGNEEYKLDIGDKFIKEFEVITTESTPTKITVYSGVVNASSVNLVAESISFNVNEISGMKSVDIKANEWVDNGDGTFTVSIPSSRHEQPPTTRYGLDLQYRNSAISSKRIAFTPEITDSGEIKITAYDALDCELLIFSAIASGDIKIITLENPTNIPDVDYNAYGVIRITQNIEPTNLTLPEPKNVGAYYSVFVSNSKLSTKKISVEGFNIEVNNGLRFKWNGENWQIAETPDKTSEITDDLNNQPLNNTLKEIPNKANKDGSNIQVEVWQNILGVDLKANNKSVELKEGLAVDNLIDFFRHFYDLRKGLNDTWEFEVGEGKNENIMNIFGFPYGESPTDSAELIVKRIATSGIGYTLELTFASKKSNTTHTAFVRGWIISGTSYDKYIHFTGWRNARGGQWVDEVNGEVTLTDTNELVLNIGEFKNPYNNFLIAEITKNNHSYNAFLMLSITAPNVGETTVKLDNEDVYVKVDYNAKTFTISKTSSGTETLKVHLYERLI